MASVILKLVVGKDPHADIYGFSMTASKNDYGTVIPDKIDGELIGNLFILPTGEIELQMPNVFGTAAALTLANGMDIDLEYIGDAYVGSSVDIVGVLIDHYDGVVELALEDTTIVVTASTPEPTPKPAPKKRKKASEE